MAERGFQACRKPRPSAPKGLLTWAFAGAAYRNRTDDLLITSKTRVIRRRACESVPAGQRPTRRHPCPPVSAHVHRLGLTNGLTPVGRQHGEAPGVLELGATALLVIACEARWR